MLGYEGVNRQATGRALRRHGRAFPWASLAGDRRTTGCRSEGWRAVDSTRYEALEELSAAEDLGSQLAGSPALATRTTRWLLATQARLGMTGQARAALTALDDERASSGEMGNARAVICLAEGDPAGALAAVAGVLEGTAPVLGYTTLVEAHLLAGLAHRQLGDQRAASQELRLLAASRTR